MSLGNGPENRLCPGLGQQPLRSDNPRVPHARPGILLFASIIVACTAPAAPIAPAAQSQVQASPSPTGGRIDVSTPAGVSQPSRVVSIELFPAEPRIGEPLIVAVRGLFPGELVHIQVLPGSDGLDVRAPVDGIARATFVVSERPGTGTRSITVTSRGETLVTRSFSVIASSPPASAPSASSPPAPALKADFSVEFIGVIPAGSSPDYPPSLVGYQLALAVPADTSMSPSAIQSAVCGGRCSWSGLSSPGRVVVLLLRSPIPVGRHVVSITLSDGRSAEIALE